MEYDRALYRVYERILEDLGSSQSFFHLETSMENDSPHQNSNRRNVIPFLLPLSIVRLQEKIRRYGLRQTCYSFTTRDGNGCNYLQRCFVLFRHRPIFHRLHNSDDRSDVEIQQATSSAFVELTPLTQTSTSSETGLRRRTQTRPNSAHHNGVMEETTTNIQDEDDTEVNPSATSRMAQNIALSHQERRRLHQEQIHRESDLCNQRGLYTFMRFSFVFAIWHMLVLSCLHFTYIGPRISKPLQSDGRILNAKSSMARQTCIEAALSTRPESERSNFFAMAEEQDITEKDNNSIFPLNRNDMQLIGNSTSVNTTVPLLGRDEMLQIKIIYGNSCGDTYCSRVRYVVPSKADANETARSSARWKLWSHLGLISDTNKYDDSWNDNMKNADLHYASESYWKEPHYKFSTNEALMFLDDNMLRYHNVSFVNITLTERCLSTGHDQGSYSRLSSFAQFLSQIYGMDSIIMNQVMYGVKTSEGDFRNGYLHNLRTNERWSYSRFILKQEFDNNHGIYPWLMNRFSALVASILAFAMVTSLTALIIRVLTTSGVMLFFPMFSYLRRLGLPGINDRILEYSYPWVGVARRVIRRAGNYPEKYFIYAHLGKVFIVYTMYESCQYAFSSFLYGKSVPQNLTIWIFGFAMILEYFSMIFVRSAVR